MEKTVEFPLSEMKTGGKGKDLAEVLKRYL